MTRDCTIQWHQPALSTNLKEVVGPSSITLDSSTTGEVASPEAVGVVSIWEKVILLCSPLLVGSVHLVGVARRGGVQQVHFAAICLLEVEHTFVVIKSVSVSAQDGIIVLGKAHTRSTPSLSSLTQGCPQNSANVCLVEHRLFPNLEGGMLAASFLHSFFLQAISAVMLWSVYVQTVPQASKHLCLAMLQTRCDDCCAC